MSEIELVPSRVTVAWYCDDGNGKTRKAVTWDGFVCPTVPGLAITPAVHGLTGNPRSNRYTVTQTESGCYVICPVMTWERAVAVFTALAALPIDWTATQDDLKPRGRDILMALRAALPDIQEATR